MLKTKKEGDISAFGRLKRKISDFFYGISVRIAAKTHKNKKIVTMAGKRKKQLIFYWSLVALPLLQYLVFYIGVNFNSILLAFRRYQYQGGVTYFEFAGLENFSLIFNDFVHGVVLKKYLGNSLVFYAFGLFITTPISLIFSYYIYKKFAWSEFFRVILFLPGIISSVVTVQMYMFTLNNGLVELFRLFGKEILRPTGEANLRMAVTLGYNFLMGFGTNIIMYASAMTRIPVSVVEYAELDGVKPLREFFTITIPLIFDTISTFLIVGIASIFVNQASVHILYPITTNSLPLEVTTLGYYLFSITGLAQTEALFPYAAAMGIIFTIIVFPLTMLFRRLLDKINPDVQT